MKRHNSDPQSTANRDPAATPKRKPSTLQRIGAITGLAVAVGLTAGIATVVEHGDHKPSTATSTSANYPKYLDKYEKYLERELLTAYVGPVVLTGAENTGQVITDNGGEKRGVVKIHIGGAAINEKTAESTGGLNYAPQPIERLVLPNGQTYPGEIHWTYQQGGDADMNPVLRDFSGSKPKTYDYYIQLGADGLISGNPEQSASGRMSAEYNAGEVAITGQNDRITSVEVIPRPEDVPAIQIELN